MPPVIIIYVSSIMWDVTGNMTGALANGKITDSAHIHNKAWDTT